jgi:ParB family transcriptional regulator, chromosome partitioning protein
MTPDTIIEIDPNEVRYSNRIGLLWPEKVEAMAALMKRDGQNDPIKVRKSVDGGGWMLVAGLHRLEGAKLARLMVKATIVDGDALQLRLIEASENMHRRDLGPIEKALFVRALADVYEAQFTRDYGDASPQSIGQRKRWATLNQTLAEGDADAAASHSAATIAGLYGWQDQAAAALGMSPRSLRDSLVIHRQIIAALPTHYEWLARHPIGQKRANVMKLAEIADLDDRQNVIDCILEWPVGKITVEQAMAECGCADAKQAVPAQGQTKFLNNAAANLDRLSASSWRSWAPTLAEKVKPSALVAVRAALDARIEALRASGDLTEEDE